MDCVFCKIVNNIIPSSKVYEDQEFLAFLDIHPVSYGHTLVIPKAHFDRFDLTPPEVIGRLYTVVRKIALGIMKGVAADGYNLGLNNGSSAGQVIFHTHVHVIPRKNKDGLELWPAQEYEGNQMDEIAKKIRASIKEILVHG